MPNTVNDRSIRRYLWVGPDGLRDRGSDLRAVTCADPS